MIDEKAISEILSRNGWDDDDCKRVLFMLRNRKPKPRSEKEIADAIYHRYGTNLSAFFADAYAEVISNAQRRRAGGV